MREGEKISELRLRHRMLGVEQNTKDMDWVKKVIGRDNGIR